MRHVERGPELSEPLLNLFGSLPIAFGGWRDAKRPQQIGRRPARITRLAEDRMQSRVGQVVKHQVDDAPGVKGLCVGRRVGLAVGVHKTDTTSAGPSWESQLETVPGNVGFTLKWASNPNPIPAQG